MEQKKEFPKKKPSEIAKALVEFQGQVPPVKMDKESKSERDQSFSYKYASLLAIFSTIRPVLYGCRLAVTQKVLTNLSDGIVSVKVKTILMHESGETLEDELEMWTGKTDPQGVGSLLTYAKRYSLSAMLGIVTEEDDDGKGAQPDAVTVGQQKKPVIQLPPSKEPVKESPREPVKQMQRKPTEEEQAAKGLIGEAKITALQALRKLHDIPDVRWKNWLYSNLKVASAWLIKVSDVDSVEYVLANNPEEVKNFTLTDDVAGE